MLVLPKCIFQCGRRENPKILCQHPGLIFRNLWSTCPDSEHDDANLQFLSVWPTTRLTTCHISYIM